MALPRITVVTPSYNQGRFLGRTIDSVLSQHYPDLEHVVVDALSTDDTADVLARYPHLRVIRERDRGQGDAINKGFRLATGDVFCFLNSDDTLLPGTLHRVASVLDPSRGIHVVQGRCRFIDENDEPTGLEHPSRAVSFLRMLQVWKTHCVPQPATFWTREVWERCGGLDESMHIALDYDLFCRFRRRYRFHFLDDFLATYRLHGDSKTCTSNNDRVFDAALAASRRYWGPWWHPRRWLLAASVWWHRFEMNSRGTRWPLCVLDRTDARNVRLRRRPLALTRAPLLAPRWALRLLTRRVVRRWIDALLFDVPRTDRLWDGGFRDEVLTFRSFTGRHPDGMIGPLYRERVRVRPGDVLRLEAEEAVSPMPGGLTVTVTVNGRAAATASPDRGGKVCLTVPLDLAAFGECEVEVRSSSYVTSFELTGERDFRPLSLRLRRLEAAVTARAAA